MLTSGLGSVSSKPSTINSPTVSLIPSTTIKVFKKNLICRIHQASALNMEEINQGEIPENNSDVSSEANEGNQISKSNSDSNIEASGSTQNVPSVSGNTFTWDNIQPSTSSPAINAEIDCSPTARLARKRVADADAVTPELEGYFKSIIPISVIMDNDSEISEEDIIANDLLDLTIHEIRVAQAAHEESLKSYTTPRAIQLELDKDVIPATPPAVSGLAGPSNNSTVQLLTSQSDAIRKQVAFLMDKITKLRHNASGGNECDCDNCEKYSVEGRLRKQNQPSNLDEMTKRVLATNSKALIEKIKEANNILKFGIPVSLDSKEVIDNVVTVLSVLKCTFPMEDKSAAAMDKRLSVKVSRAVIEHIGNIVGDWRNFFIADKNLRQYTYESIRSKFKAGNYIPDVKTDDIDIFIKHKPMELIGDFFTYLILELINGDFLEAVEIAVRLKKNLESPYLYKRNEFEKMYAYLTKSVQLLIEALLAPTLDILKPDDGGDVVDIPSDEGWNQDMQNNRFLIWFFVERNCKGSGSGMDDPIFIENLLEGNINDVECLVTVANQLREKRLKSPFPKSITPLEKSLVSRAYALEPHNPFVLLSLLDTLSDKKKELTPEFELTCRNLLYRFRSVNLQLQVSKYFNKRHRNRNMAKECIKRAVILNPKHAAANFMCGKYLCQKIGKVDFGVGFKDAFYRVAVTSDFTNFEYSFEYFKTTLGKTGSRNSAATNTSLFGASGSSSSGAAGIGDSPRYISAAKVILNSPYTKAWTTAQRGQLTFLMSLSYFLRKEHEYALEILIPVYNINQVTSMMQDLDKLGSMYDWDVSLRFETYRKWLLSEYEDIIATEEGGSSIHSMDEDDLFDMESDNGSIGNENEDGNVEDDPLKEMLAYLTRVL